MKRWVLSACLAAASLTLTSCVQPRTVTWTEPQLRSTERVNTLYVCLELPPEQLFSARLAVESWDRSLRQWKRIVAVDGDHEPCRVYVKEVTMPNVDNPIALAWASKLGGNYVYMRRWHYEHDVTAILAHELGHVFGAQHVAGTLMSAVWQLDSYWCPDVVTVAQVAAWNDINLATLSWCVK